MLKLKKDVSAEFFEKKRPFKIWQSTNILQLCVFEKKLKVYLESWCNKLSIKQPIKKPTVKVGFIIKR